MVFLQIHLYGAAQLASSSGQRYHSTWTPQRRNKRYNIEFNLDPSAHFTMTTRLLEVSSPRRDLTTIIHFFAQSDGQSNIATVS